MQNTSLNSNELNEEFHQIYIKSPQEIIQNKLIEINKILEEIAKNRGSIVFAILYDSYVPIQREHVSKIFSKFKSITSTRIGDVSAIDIILHTTGGDADAAYHLGYIIQKYVEELEKQNERNNQNKIELNVIIPRIAKSAGTLLSLCGDKIILTRLSELGPIDPQIRSERGIYVSAKTMRDSLKQVLEIISELGSSRKSERLIEDKAVESILRRIPVTEMGHYESLMNHVSELAKELLSSRMLRSVEKEKVKEIADRLVRKYEYHGYVLTYWHLKEMGVKCELASEDLEKKLTDIYEYFEGIEKIVSTYLLPPLLPLPEFIIQYMFEVHELDNGVVILPTPPKEIDEMIEGIIESIMEKYQIKTGSKSLGITRR